MSKPRKQAKTNTFTLLFNFSTCGWHLNKLVSMARSKNASFELFFPIATYNNIFDLYNLYYND